MQKSKPKYACLPRKIVQVWIERFCVRYDWWCRLQPTSSVSPVFSPNHHNTWWHHQMETFSVLLALCVGNSPVNSSHKGQWRGDLMFSLICAWLNGWVNDCESGGLRRLYTHYDVTVMRCPITRPMLWGAFCEFGWASLSAFAMDYVNHAVQERLLNLIIYSFKIWYTGPRYNGIWLPTQVTNRMRLMACCRTAVTPVRWQWSYCSLALSHQMMCRLCLKIYLVRGR